MKLGNAKYLVNRHGLVSIAISEILLITGGSLWILGNYSAANVSVLLALFFLAVGLILHLAAYVREERKRARPAGDIQSPPS